ncbi:MAG: hypothetical protein ABW275_02775 [Hansschlegelia sp.]
MKSFILALGALSLASTVALADEPGMLRWNTAAPSSNQAVTKDTITGYAASAAAAENVPLNPAPRQPQSVRRFGGIEHTGLVRTMERKNSVPASGDSRGSQWDGDSNEG